MKQNRSGFEKTNFVLGAHALTVHLINKAKEMGVYTIVTDFKDAPAKMHADEAYDISTLDIDALVELAREKRCFTGYVDVNLAPCSMVI